MELKFHYCVHYSPYPEQGQSSPSLLILFLQDAL
jgi:hypothetical protein